MNHLTQFFIRNNKFTLVLSIFLVVFGLGALNRLNSESFPAVNMATAIVTTNYDGASAEDIEIKITKPIENEIRSVDGVKDVRSVSQSGLSTIVVRIDIDNADVEQSMADLQRAIDKVSDLPGDLKDPPSFMELKSEEFPVMEFAIVGSNEDRNRDLIADLLKEEMEDNKSVLEVRFSGFTPREFLIQLDPLKLQSHHIGVNEVITKIRSRNVNIPGGHLEETETQTLLRLEAKIQTKTDIENIVLRSNFSGEKILVKDIASVIDGSSEAEVLTHYKGSPATLVTITKKGGADTLKLVADLESKLENFKQKYKNDYEFDVYHNEGDKVRNRLNVLASNAISGLVLVIVFLLIFLPGRIGLVASLSLPLAVLGTIGFMPLFGMNLNTITILALVIALGMLVDNSVVISENYARLRKNGLDRSKAASKSIASLWLPITATAFTTIAAFLPMLVTKGIMGQFIKYIPILVTIALLMSLAESFFLLPMRLIIADKKVDPFEKEAKNKGDWFQTKLLPFFGKNMRFLLKHRYLTMGAYTILLIGALVMMTIGNKMILFPADQTEVYMGRLTMPEGSKLELTNQALVEASQKIQKTIGEHITHVVTRAGTQTAGPNDPKGKTGDYVGMISIYVNDHARNNIPHTELIKKLNTVTVASAKELVFEALVNGPPVGEAINATVRSNNKANLNELSKALIERLSKVEGIRDASFNDVIGDDQVFINIDYSRADQLNLDINGVGQAIRSAISGKVISDVTLNNKKVDLKLKFKREARKNISDLSHLKVMDQRGHLIPLSEFASFRTESGSPQIKRFDYKRSKTITASINEEKITAIEANNILLKEFSELQKTYNDASIVFGGEAESTKESMQSLWDALVLSLIGIFALLVFMLSSYLRPLIIMSTIPLGLVGFSVAFSLHQRPISFLALIGVIGLGGIIVNSGIVLISFIEELKKCHPERPLNDILVEASQLRLRAVVVSSLTTISGLLPTAYGIGGSDAILIPMTLAMAWGLTSGTLLTIMWVPCAYAILEDVNGWIKNLLQQGMTETFDETKDTSYALNDSVDLGEAELGS